jgi:hypothetical protein
LLVALFAEDIGLLPKYFVAQLIDECKEPADAYDLIGGLFVAMNTPGKISGGRFKGVDYFNGGLFREPARLELRGDELAQLRAAAKSNWSQVRPEIFGTLFEHSLGAEERHAFGAHFTSPVDIMKIVGPTIVEPWRERIENATTQRELRALLGVMHHYRVLDPACGSGNFLYIAYRELKRLEARIRERLVDISTRRTEPDQILLGFVTAQQFFGIDINSFAVELAKVTMTIARKLAIDELHVSEPALPLDNLDGNFCTGDALIDEMGNPQDWSRIFRDRDGPIVVKHDVVIGNPPFLGAKLLKPERGTDYVNAVRRAYPDVPGMADYCVYWVRKAHDHLEGCTSENPLRGRAGLVGTQNVRNNQSRVGGLDYVVSTGTIVEAVDNQPWSGEANVHVSIVNWAKTQDAALLPREKRLWFKVDEGAGKKKRKSRGSGSATKEYELNFRVCDLINSAVSDRADVGSAVRLACNIDPKRVYQGVTPGHKAFVLSREEKARLLQKEAISGEVIFPYLIGREILTGSGAPTRYLIDFQQRDVLACQRYKAAFGIVESKVLPARRANAEKGRDAAGNIRPHHRQFLDRWWKLAWDRADLIDVVSRMRRFLVCSRVTKRPVFVFVDSSIRPGDALQAFVFDDDFSFGILQANPHWQWFVANCSKLTERFRYTPESIFDTYPWPQSPSTSQVDAVAGAGREVRRIRSEALRNIRGGLRGVYRTLELPGKSPLKDAHAALDAAVQQAYGLSAKKDLLAQLLALNHDVAQRIERGESVTAPGVPAGYPDASRLVTEDCVQP